ATLANTIVARNSATNGPDGNGFLFNSQDYNLIENTNGMTLLGTLTHVIIGQDPLLGPLQNNGGPSPTMALLPNSPAIDQGRSFGLIADQRGFARPYNLPSIANAAEGDGSDIGAYELIPTPQLNIQRAPDNNVVLFWSTDAADFRLESVTNLPSAMNNWQEVTNARTYTANLAFVTNTASGTQKYYRLNLPAMSMTP
ncbi:MAG TPA: choice-of-anchor Q domain-containing protein, partial [Verrucomicrobiae bacterium]|nr:choice-of-anchor Q domain-containing protein [Verrucomicrobiae bacterium]